MAGAASATLALDASQPGLFGAALKPQWWSGSQSLRAQEHCKGPMLTRPLHCDGYAWGEGFHFCSMTPDLLLRPRTRKKNSSIIRLMKQVTSKTGESVTCNSESSTTWRLAVIHSQETQMVGRGMLPGEFEQTGWAK